ncbi:MAG: hypothetical protein R3E32_25275 [Chitinophagales bacterium]
MENLVEYKIFISSDFFKAEELFESLNTPIESESDLALELEEIPEGSRAWFDPYLLALITSGTLLGTLKLIVGHLQYMHKSKYQKYIIVEMKDGTTFEFPLDFVDDDEAIKKWLRDNGLLLKDVKSIRVRKEWE